MTTTKISKAKTPRKGTETTSDSSVLDNQKLLEKFLEAHPGLVNGRDFECFVASGIFFAYKAAPMSVTTQFVELYNKSQAEPDSVTNAEMFDANIDLVKACVLSPSQDELANIIESVPRSLGVLVTKINEFTQFRNNDFETSLKKL
jgi:hypothetical protein